jgi:NTE family protein
MKNKNYFNKIMLNLGLKKEKIGLALGGGGAKGFAHFPIINGILENNIKIDYVSGTSIGAIIGAYFCLHGEVNSWFDKLQGFRNRDWLKFLDISFKTKNSVVKGKEFEKYLKTIFGNKTFDDLKIPFIVTVTNLKTGELEYINSGKLIDAIIASSAYPGIFPASKIRNNYYVDGGVLDNLPFKILEEKKMDKIIAVSLSKMIEEPIKIKDCNNSKDILLRVNQIRNNYIHQLKYSLNENIFLLEPNVVPKFADTWNVLDKKDRIQLGIDEFNANKVKLLNWLRV